MPRKGYTCVTMRSDNYETFKQEWSKRKKEYIKKGVTSFSGYIACRLSELTEIELERSGEVG